MIIELFGPPAAGKNTLAHALTTALEKNGFDVQLIASSRPAESCSAEVDSVRALSWCKTALVAPLRRAAKFASAVPVLLDGTHSDELATGLMDLLPPRTLSWTIRYRRFLFLLSRSWKAASTSEQITIFDQGFLTALCSMALLTRSVDRTILARGLALIPRPDLLIRLDAPRGTLEDRLRARLDRQGGIERLFEFDLQTSLRQIETTDEISNMLHEQGGRCVQVRSLDRHLLDEAVERIVRDAESWNENTDPLNSFRVERRRIVRGAR
jgi:thymidylate kinase